MGKQLASGNEAVALLGNSLATASVLTALIYSLLPLSHAHFNPAVSLVAALRHELPFRHLPVYVVTQLAGALAGVVMAHAMFGRPLLALAHRQRIGSGQLFSEFVATFGLLLVIQAMGKRTAVVPVAVGAYIFAAHWFTASTSFANPSVTTARMFTDSSAGIAPRDIWGFVVAQFSGALAAMLLFRWFESGRRRS